MTDDNIKQKYELSGLEDELTSIENGLEDYRITPQGLNTVLEKYDDDKISEDGLYIAKKYVVGSEFDLREEFESFDIMDYVFTVTGDQEQVANILFEHFGEEILSLEQNLDRLITRRQELFKKSRNYLIEDLYKD